MNLQKIGLVAALAGLMAFNVSAAGPQGFDNDRQQPSTRMPQGFEVHSPVTVKWVKESAKDDDFVTLRGRFVAFLRGDKYEFMDEDGVKIVAELDKDWDWSHVRRGDLYEIYAEVEKNWSRVKLEVHKATRLE